MFLRSLFIVLSTFQLFGMQQPYVHLAKSTSVLEPESTLLAFDLDGVVLAGREEFYKNWIAEHPQFGKAIEDVKKNHKLFDAYQIINKVAQEHPEMKDLAEEFKKVIITASSIKDTIDTINSASKKGYGIVAASNMTQSTYESMVDNQVLPLEFTKAFFFVATNPLNKKKDGSYHAKPSIEYFQNLIKYVENKYPGKFTTYIFTDDKKSNADGAAATGKIKAIHFITPAQFKQELQKLGVNLD